MLSIPGKALTRQQLTRYIGSTRQIGGIARYRQTEGPGKDSEVALLRTGSGFDLTVLIDRGMDLSTASYRGIPLAWASPSGEAHPHRFLDQGLGWLRTFSGGLLTTCGLRQTGAPCTDEGEELGLHGRYTSLSPENVSHTEEWEGDRFLLRLSGEMREAVIFGENLLLRREWEAVLGEPRLRLRDRVTNEGSRPTPHMILYHCNLGFPLLSPATRLHTPHSAIEPRDPGYNDTEGPCEFIEPVADYRERVFYHEMEPDSDGNVCVKLHNPDLLSGLTFQLRYRQAELPHFTQWKMMGQQEYVCGLEPGNARVGGRARERKAGRLVTLEPGETRQYEIEFSLSEGPLEA